MLFRRARSAVKPFSVAIRSIECSHAIRIAVEMKEKPAYAGFFSNSETVSLRILGYSFLIFLVEQGEGGRGNS